MVFAKIPVFWPFVWRKSLLGPFLSISSLESCGFHRSHNISTILWSVRILMKFKNGKMIMGWSWLMCKEGIAKPLSKFLASNRRLNGQLQRRRREGGRPGFTRKEKQEIYLIKIVCRKSLATLVTSVKLHKVQDILRDIGQKSRFIMPFNSRCGPKIDIAQLFSSFFTTL